MTGCLAPRFRPRACSWSSSRCRGVRRACAARGSTARPRWRSRPGARAQGVRVQAVRRPGGSPEGPRRRWMLVDTRDETGSIQRGEFSEDEELLDLPLDAAGVADPDPIYLVCSHGRHDPCCGQRGRPVVAALAASRPDRVWQASHLGGCRFAPTVLVLPLGLMYGRVPASAADELIAATEAGQLAKGMLRGRIGIRRPRRPRGLRPRALGHTPGARPLPWSRRTPWIRRT